MVKTYERCPTVNRNGTFIPASMKEQPPLYQEEQVYERIGTVIFQELMSPAPLSRTLHGSSSASLVLPSSPPSTIGGT